MARKKQQTEPAYEALYAVLVTYPHHPVFQRRQDFLRLSVETYELLETTTDIEWARNQQQYYQQRYPRNTYTVVSIQPI